MTIKFSGRSGWRLAAFLMHGLFWCLAGLAVFVANSLEYPIEIALINAALITAFGATFSAPLLALVARSGQLDWQSMAQIVPFLLLLSPMVTAPGNYLTFVAVGIDIESLQWVYFFQGGVRNGLIFVIWGALMLSLRGRMMPGTAQATLATAMDQKIQVEQSGSTQLIDPVDIRYIRAASDYVELEGIDGSYLKRITMKKLEQSLGPRNFVRVHRSLLVNMRHVAGFRSKRSGDFIVEMKAGEELGGSRRFKTEFQARVATFSE